MILKVKLPPEEIRGQNLKVIPRSHGSERDFRFLNQDLICISLVFRDPAAAHDVPFFMHRTSIVILWTHKCIRYAATQAPFHRDVDNSANSTWDNIENLPPSSRINVAICISQQ